MKLRNLILVVALFMPVCNSKLHECISDIVFALDGSGSVSASTWELTLNFVKEFAQHITYGPNKTRIGLLTFSSHATVKAMLNQYRELKSFCDLVDETSYLEQSTNVTEAIRTARTEIFHNFGDRPSVGNFLIIVTDGRLGVDANPAIDEAALARSHGINVVAVAVNTRDSRPTLGMLTNNHQLVFEIEVLTPRRATIHNMATIICQMASNEQSLKKPTNSPFDNDLFKATTMKMRPSSSEMIDFARIKANVTLAPSFTTKQPEQSGQQDNNNDNNINDNNNNDNNANDSAGNSATSTPNFDGKSTTKRKFDIGGRSRDDEDDDSSSGSDGSATTVTTLQGSFRSIPSMAATVTQHVNGNMKETDRPGNHVTQRPGHDINSRPDASNATPLPGSGGNTTPLPGGSGGNATPIPGGNGSPIPGSGGNATPLPGSGGNASPLPGSGGYTTSSQGSGGNDSPIPGSGGNASPLPESGGYTTPLPGSGSNATPLPGSGSNASPLPGSGSNASPIPGSSGNATSLPGSGGNASPIPGSSGNATPLPGSGENASPFPGSGGNASPFPGSGGYTTPLPGSGGNASPISGSGGNASPLPGSGGNATPLPGSDGNASPLPESGGNVLPITRYGGNATPIPGSGGNASPIPGSSGNATPIPGSGGNASPLPGSGGNVSPIPGFGGNATLLPGGSGGNVTPIPGSGGNASPLPGSGGNVSPIPGSGGNATPIPGSGGNVLPITGYGGNATPLPGSGDNATHIPGTGGNATPFPGSGGNATPFPGSGGNATPIPGSGGDASPIPGSSGNATPIPGSATPIPGFSGNATPIPGSGGNASPLPGSGDNATPIPGTGGNATPLPGSGGNATPFPGSGGNATPLPGSGGNASPIPGSSGNATPIQGSGGNVLPIPGSSGNTTPLPGGSGGYATPIPGSGGNASPLPGSGGNVSSIPGSGGNATPLTGGSGDNATPIPGSGGNASPLPGSGGNVSPIPGSGGYATTLPGSGGNASPFPGSGDATPIPGSGVDASPIPGSSGNATPLPGSGGNATPLLGSGGNASPIPGSGGNATPIPGSGGNASPLPGSGGNASPIPGFGGNATPSGNTTPGGAGRYVVTSYPNSNYDQSGCVLDILFVLDGSGSVTKENFNIQLQATRAALKDFTVSPSGVNVALMTYSSEAQLHFSFTDTRYESIVEIQKRIDSVKWANQRSNHGAALKMASDLFNKKGSNRENVDNVMVLVTDSESNMDSVRRQDIKALNDAGVGVFVIAIAVKDSLKLRNIASEPIYFHFIQVLDFHEMYNTFQNLNKIVCFKNIPEPVYSLSDYQNTNVALLTSLKQDDPSLRYYLGKQLRSYSDDLGGITFFASLNGISPGKMSNDALSMAKFLDSIRSLPPSATDLETDLNEALVTLQTGYQSPRKNIILAITDPGEYIDPDRQKRLQELINEAKIKGILIFVIVKGSVTPTVLLHHRFAKKFADIERPLEIVPTLFVTDLAPIIFNCSFEDEDGTADMCGMTQATNDQFDWTVHSGGTPSRHTGPQRANRGSYYAYIEASGPRQPGDIATLIFPDFGDQIGSFICVQFSAHMSGYHTGTLFIDITPDYGKNKKIFWMLAGNQGNKWFSTQVTVLLTAKMRISAIRGSEFSSDIAIDDIVVRKGPCAMVIP